MNSEILVVGSLAFDIIFSIPEDFRKSIPLENGEIRNFNATYLANDKKEFPGGTAGNIAFWLGQEKVSSAVFSAWGKDMLQKGYFTKLSDLGVYIIGHEGEFTATAYMISDPLHQQLIVWQPNSYKKIEEIGLNNFFDHKDLENFKFAIFSAGTPASILKHMTEFREANPDAVVVFDPGQVSQFFDKEVFQKCAEFSNILIGNDIEFKYFTDYGIPENIITIETLGEKGVKFTKNGVSTNIPAIKVENVVETTGAGDAFRAGLLAEMLKGSSLEDSIKKGTHLGAKCVKFPSAQF